MAHLVKSWPCKHEDLSLILQNQKPGMVLCTYPDLVRWKQAKNSKRHCFKNNLVSGTQGMTAKQRRPLAYTWVRVRVGEGT